MAMMLAPATGLPPSVTIPEIPPVVTCAEAMELHENALTTNTRMASHRRTGMLRLRVIIVLSKMSTGPTFTIRAGGYSGMTVMKKEWNGKKALARTEVF